MRKTFISCTVVFSSAYKTFQTYSLGVTDVVARLGNGVASSLFWTFFMTGSISMAVSVLVLGYAANYLGLPVKDAVHRVLIS